MAGKAALDTLPKGVKVDQVVFGYVTDALNSCRVDDIKPLEGSWLRTTLLRISLVMSGTTVVFPSLFQPLRSIGEYHACSVLG